MRIFGKITKGLIDSALLPIDIAKDIVTLGGINTNQEEPYTVKKIKKLRDEAEDIYDSLDE